MLTKLLEKLKLVFHVINFIFMIQPQLPSFVKEPHLLTLRVIFYLFVIFLINAKQT